MKWKIVEQSTCKTPQLLPVVTIAQPRAPLAAPGTRAEPTQPLYTCWCPKAGRLSGQHVTSVKWELSTVRQWLPADPGELNLRHSPLLFSHLTSCHSVPAIPAFQVLVASASFRSQGSGMRCPLCQASLCRAPPEASSSSSFRSCLNVTSLGMPPWDSQPTSHLKQSPVFVHSPH